MSKSAFLTGPQQLHVSQASVVLLLDNTGSGCLDKPTIKLKEGNKTYKGEVTENKRKLLAAAILKFEFSISTLRGSLKVAVPTLVR